MSNGKKCSQEGEANDGDDAHFQLRTSSTLLKHRTGPYKPACISRCKSAWRFSECDCLICQCSLKKVLSLQVILISSSDDPVPDVFAKQLTQKTGCEVKHLKEEKQVALEKLLKEKELVWKEVAYIGERATYQVEQTSISRKRSHSLKDSLNLFHRIHISHYWHL